MKEKVMLTLDKEIIEQLKSLKEKFFLSRSSLINQLIADALPGLESGDYFKARLIE